MGKKLTQAEFISKSREVHGDVYDYSKVQYVGNKVKVCIICPIHGEFWQLPSSHMRGIGCPKCGVEKRAKSQTYTRETFIAKADSVHGGKYDYSKLEYKGCYEKVCIICPEHGEFWQVAYSHLDGHGCPQCMAEKNRISITSNNEEFIAKARKVHYYEDNDYSNVEYVHAKYPVEIVCPNGHHYMQIPNKHLAGHGCPYCAHSVSKGERELSEFLQGLGIGVETNNRKILSDGREIDIYIPSHRVAIEYDGLFWHCDDRKGRRYHVDKTEECLGKGIRLIHIFEDEWLYKRDIVKSRIENILGLTSRRIFARKCSVRTITSMESKVFLEENHIQGNVVSGYKYGLFHDDELVAVMTFGGLRKNLGKNVNKGTYELLRFANKLNTTVVGGADKLLTHFIREHKPNGIISYADRRWSNGGLYEKMGFELYNVSEPSYFYVVGQTRYNRFKFRKDKLVEEGFDPNKTEKEIMKERGIPRIYDCGCFCYRKEFEWEKD